MDKRIIYGILLWAAIALPLLWLSSRLFPPTEVPAETQPTPEPAAPTNGGQQPGPGPGPGPAPGPQPPVAPLPENPPETREIGNDHFHAVLSSKGASIQSLKLLTYRERYLPSKEKEHQSGEKPIELIYEADPAHHTLAMRVLEGEQDPIDARDWAVTSKPGEMPIVFEWTGPTGLRVVKRFSLSQASPYAMEVEIEASCEQGGVFRFETEAQAGLAKEDDSTAYYPAGLIARAESAPDGSRARISAVEEKTRVGEFEKKAEVSLSTAEYGPGWAGVASRYFLVAVVPMTDSFGQHPVETTAFQPLNDSRERHWLERWDPPVPGAPPEEQKAREARLEKGSKVGILALYRSPQVDLGKGPWKWRALVYAGPKTEDDLSGLKSLGLDRAIDYGTFGFISKFLLAILGLINKVVGNWGWSIVVLTLLVRAAIFPLNRKAQISAHKMSKIQPKMLELREKHAKDKDRLGKEMMRLYQEHGVNPIGGCLPIFLQLPILYGLYNAVWYTIDLRQQPFLGWIRDLSQADMLFEWHFDGIACCMGGPLLKTEYFNLLPLLMMLTWFFQSLTYPKPTDPQAAQTQKMMMWMPLFFGLMMFSMMSGLILYWMTSTFLGICEQQYIKRVLLPKL